MKLKFSVNKKIKNSREEEKVLERLGQSDFANTQRILLLLRSRLEFRSRSSLSIDEELDWIFYNESRTETGTGTEIGTGDAMDAIGTSDLEMINNLNQNILSTLLDLSTVENGQMENVKDQSGASTSGFWILDETVTPRVPDIYPALPSLHELRALCEFCCPIPGTPPAVSTMPTAPTSPLPPQPQLVENGQMENITGQSGDSTSGFQETVTPPLPHIFPALPSLQHCPCPSTPPAVSTKTTAPTAPLSPQPHHFCAPIAPLTVIQNARSRLVKGK